MKFLLPPIPVCRGAYIPCFKINAPIFSCLLFSENHLNPQVRINKMVNKHTVDYKPSTWQLTSRIHPLIFLWTPKGFFSPESFLIFSETGIPPWLRKSFKFIVSLRLPVNTFVSQKIESVHFYPSPQAELSTRNFVITPMQKKITHSSRTAFSKDLFFPLQKGGRRIMELKKLPRLNLPGYWSQVLINYIVATFAFLVSVLLYHNLASRILKCQGFLTHKVFTKRYSVQE